MFSVDDLLCSFGVGVEVKVSECKILKTGSKIAFDAHNVKKKYTYLLPDGPQNKEAKGPAHISSVAMVAACGTAFYITLVLKHHRSQLEKKAFRTMRSNNNCLPISKGGSGGCGGDGGQCNASALVALSCFCQTSARTMKSLVKKREIVFGL